MKLIDRMHKPFRDSKARNLRALLASLEAGLALLSVRGFNAGLYLETAEEDALHDWADTYAVDPSGMSEEELRAYLQQEVLLRNRSTEVGIEAAIFRQTGVTAAVRPTMPHVARYDDQERMQGGYRMADYRTYLETRPTGIPWGGGFTRSYPGFEDRYYEDDPSHLGYRGLTPARAPFGPDGFIVYIAADHDPSLESTVLAILGDHAAAGSGYTLFWAHRFEMSGRAEVQLRDHDPLNPTKGFGCAPFGWNFGTPHVTAEGC